MIENVLTNISSHKLANILQTTLAYLKNTFNQNAACVCIVSYHIISYHHTIIVPIFIICSHFYLNGCLRRDSYKEVIPVSETWQHTN